MFTNMTMLLKIFIVSTICGSLGEREHKVHNIILYPERHSWCQTTPIQQVVASPGYESVTIDNNICVGACYSYSIPRTQPAEPGEIIGPYCDSCQPIETKCYHVTLHADGKNLDGPKTTQKRVQIILECSCMSCEKIHKEDCEITDETTLELPSDLFSHNSNRTSYESKVASAAQSKSEDVPELLHFAPERNRYTFNLNYEMPERKFNLNDQLIDLLKKIQNEKNFDQSKLKDLMKIVDPSTDQNLMDFVNYVNIHNTDDLELDLGKLKKILDDYKKNYDIDHNTIDQGNDDNSRNGKKKTHHIGEEMQVGLDMGHLVKGPHGSMVLAPDLKVEEKLNIDSDILKPNHDGVVISYENHHLQQHQHNTNKNHDDLIDAI